MHYHYLVTSDECIEYAARRARREVERDEDLAVEVADKFKTPHFKSHISLPKSAIRSQGFGCQVSGVRGKLKAECRYLRSASCLLNFKSAICNLKSKISVSPCLPVALKLPAVLCPLSFVHYPRIPFLVPRS
jgi:hypothetical protein